MNGAALMCHRTATEWNFWDQNKPVLTLFCEVFCHSSEKSGTQWASFLIRKSNNEVLCAQGSNKRSVLNRVSLPAPTTLWGQWIFMWNLQSSVCTLGWGSSSGHWYCDVLSIILNTTDGSLFLEPWACLFKNITILSFSAFFLEFSSYSNLLNVGLWTVILIHLSLLLFAICQHHLTLQLLWVCRLMTTDFYFHLATTHLLIDIS